MMVLGMVITSAVCFMLVVHDHPYSSIPFGLLAILPIAYFFKTYALSSFYSLPTTLTKHACALACAVRVCSKQTFIPETFKCPLVPLTPILGILCNIYLMANLTAVYLSL
jgi:hypothetical protein